MELRHLRYFVMVAEEENVSRAAARLNVSQPAVSRQIRDLEEELGVSLFERERLGLVLTTAGQTALAQAREVLRQAAALQDVLRPFRESGRRVSLRVAYLPTALPMFLADGLRRFNQRYPEVCVQIFELSPLEQESALRKGTIDLALLGQPRGGMSDSFKVEVLHKTPIVVALPEGHPLAERKAIDLAELKDDEFIGLSQKSFPTRPQMMETLFSKAGYRPRGSVEAKGLSELLGLVGSGAGVAVVPLDLEKLPHARVVFVKLRRPTYTLSFAAVWRKDESLEAVEQFVGLLRG